jgi:hypothetical protein
MLKRTLLARRQMRTEWHLRQTQWLVQAGLERAARRVASDAQYLGERWSLEADTIAGTAPGLVTIAVRHESTGRANLRIVAEYPSGGAAAIRRTREFVVNRPQE